MPIYPGVSDSQKKVPPLPPSVASRSDSGSGRAFDNGATFLTFNPTVFDGKLPIIDYVVTAVSETNELVTNTVTNLAPFVFTGLRSGVRYRYRIRARNSVSESVDSSEVGPDTATTVPGRPTSLTAINLSNGGGITLNWVAPPNAGKAITSYTITPTVGAPIVTNSASTTYAFSGVVGTTYNFTVAATNENGTGENSTASGTVVPTVPATTAPPPPPPTTTQAPGGGSGLAFTSITGSGGVGISSGIYSVTLNFTGNAFTQSYSWSGPLGSGASANGTSAVGFVSQVSCGVTYTFTVTLYTGVNQTGSSLTQSVTASATCVGGGGTTSGVTPAPSPTCVGNELSPRGNFVAVGGNDEVRCVGTLTYETSVLTYYNASTGQYISCRGAELGPYSGDPRCAGSTTTTAPGGGTTTTAPATTFCPSLGVNVPLSGFPGNCPGASTTTSAPTTTAAPTTTCSPSAGNECYCACGSGQLLRRTCSGTCPCGCVGTTTTAPTTTRAATTTARPTTSGCACRDFRGRCVSIAFCLA